MRWISSIGQWLQRLWPWGPKPYRVERVEDFPDRLRDHRVYIAGENGHAWAAAMRCPCGCGDVIHMNLLPESRPRWTVEERPDGVVTLHPSVWRRKGCRSHFFVRGGEIVRCAEQAGARVAQG